MSTSGKQYMLTSNMNRIFMGLDYANSLAMYGTIQIASGPFLVHGTTL
jgi:hypothetical protein